MPTMQQTVDQQPELAPELRETLQTALNSYLAYQEQIKMLKALQDDAGKDLQAVLEDAGVGSYKVPEATITIIRGTNSRLDKKKLYAQGITVAQVEAATTRTPKKPYVKVTRAGEKDTDDAGEE